MQRDWITSALDILALLLIAAGTACAVYSLVGWACLVAAGAVVAVGSWLATLARRPGGRQ